MIGLSNTRGRLIVTGTGGASGYSLALEAEQCGYQVLWADADLLSPALLLHPERRVVLPLANDPMDYIPALTRAAEEFGTQYISLNTDAEVRLASFCATAFANAGLQCWTPEWATVNDCTDKSRFELRLASIDGFRTPHTYSVDEVSKRLPDGGVFLKRRIGSGATDALPCTSQLQLDAWLARNPDGLIQQLLTGEEFSADCLYTGLDSPLVVLRRRLRTRSGMSTVTTTYHDDRVETAVSGLVRQLGVVGPACVQGFMESDGVYFTEINVRFGGGCAAAIWGGTSLVEIYLDLLTTQSRRLGTTIPPVRAESEVSLIRPHSYVVVSS